MSVKELGDDKNDEIEAVEISQSNTQKVTKQGLEAGVWVNQERVPVSIPIVCHVPQKISIVMRSIEQLMIKSDMGALEFGMFLNGVFTEEGKLVLSEDFYMPQQKVSGASIDFEEEPPEPKYNGVIHRHPSGCKSFSGTDSFHINRNFDFSILYVDNDIITGVFNLQVGQLRIQLPLRTEIMYPIFDLESNSVLSKIHRNEAVMKSSTVGNPLFEDQMDFRKMLNSHDDINDILEDEDEDEEEKLYFCKKCGAVQYIGDFPQCCESCEEILDETDFELVSDITNLDEEMQQKVFTKMQEER